METYKGYKIKIEYQGTKYTAIAKNGNSIIIARDGIRNEAIKEVKRQIDELENED